MRRRQGSTSIEFAAVALPFLALMLFIFELGYDLYSQEELESGLHVAARQIATGNAQNVQNGAAFVANYMCPDMAGLLECNTNVFIQVQKVSPTTAQDYYSFTTGDLPVTGNTLNLANYGSASFCNSGPTEMLLISAVYVGPTFIGGLFPGILTVFYNGRPVHASFASVGVVSEGYPPTGASGTTPVASAC